MAMCRKFQGVWILLALMFSVACGGTQASGSIGAVLGKDRQDGRLFVRDAPPGMSAARSGVDVGDEIVAIDGQDVRGMSIDDVHNMLRGKIGTKVVLTIDRSGARRDVTVERGPLRE
jgi:carboxyl-terminal processing protease